MACALIDHTAERARGSEKLVKKTQPSMLVGQLHPARVCASITQLALRDQWRGNGAAIIYRITRPLDPTIHLAFATACFCVCQTGENWRWRAASRPVLLESFVFIYLHTQ